MAIASELGYRVAALEIDTKDWFETNPQQIVANALEALETRQGRIVLLHDAGGDRASTIAALGPLIDSLRARGYEPTTVAGLLNVAPQAGTPSAPLEEAPQRALNLAALQVASFSERMLVATFLVALVLGLLRLLVIGTLAALQRFVPRFAKPRYGRRAHDAEYAPMVSVVVPAYNEGRVIGRTVRSVLAQEYSRFEVLVIDDGSSDDTATAARLATDDARVRVITQANGGKAAAINHGMSLATGDVIVVIDADTLLAPDAIRHLVRPLADPRVGAVAGNAKVGNRVNLVTRWQAVEYVTSQNFDRRAFAAMNCIGVVPGALGAWRRDAVLAVGGYSHDTLVEDADLTLSLLRAGAVITYEPGAVARTEAPETLAALWKQRVRWTYGTYQCLAKHRGALLRGTLGWVALPNLLLFQVLFPLVTPLGDLAMLYALSTGRWSALLSGYAGFLVMDLLASVLAFYLDHKPYRWLALLLVQRFVYRPLLCAVSLRAMLSAAMGARQGWRKLERTGTVSAVSLLPPRGA